MDIIWTLSHMDIVIAAGIVIIVMLVLVNYWARKFYKLFETDTLEAPRPPRDY